MCLYIPYNCVCITVDPIWMDDVRCLRGEEVLDECTFRGWGVHNCQHNDDVGVVCVPGEDLTVHFGIHTIGWVFYCECQK